MLHTSLNLGSPAFIRYPRGAAVGVKIKDQPALLPVGLPASFDTAELAAAAGIDRRLAQQMAYCLRLAGALEPTGRRGRAAVYRLA